MFENEAIWQAGADLSKRFNN